MTLYACHEDRQAEVSAADGNAASGVTVARADINQDGIVDREDLHVIASYMGEKIDANASAELRRCDINKDNKINIQDLVIVSGFVGQRVPAPDPSPSPSSSPSVEPSPPPSEQQPPTAEELADPDHYGQYQLVGNNRRGTYNVRIKIEDEIPTSLTFVNAHIGGNGIEIPLQAAQTDDLYRGIYNGYEYTINWQDNLLLLLTYIPINDINEDGMLYVRGSTGRHNWEITPDTLKAAFDG